MILVDNFKTVLLVGLICTIGISPSFGQDDSAAGDEATTVAGAGGGGAEAGGGSVKCKGAAKDCTAGQVCMVVPHNWKGCVDPTACADVTPAGAAMMCKADFGCCCKGENCDDMSVPEIKKSVCDALGEEKCKDSSGGGGGGGGEGGGDGTKTKCKLPNGGEEMECEANKKGCDKSGCIEMCADDKKAMMMDGDKVNCTIDGGCCCVAIMEKSCDYGGSTGLLGSFSLVSVVAAALYFIPFKSS